MNSRKKYKTNSCDYEQLGKLGALAWRVVSQSFSFSVFSEKRRLRACFNFNIVCKKSEKLLLKKEEMYLWR